VIASTFRGLRHRNFRLWFFGQLESRLRGPARLQRIRVAESDALAAEFPAR